MKLCVAVDDSSSALPAKCARSVPLAPGNDVKNSSYIPKGGGPVTVGGKDGTSPDTRVNVIVAPGTPWPVHVSVKLPCIPTIGGEEGGRVVSNKVKAVGHRTGPGDCTTPCVIVSVEDAVHESEIGDVLAAVSHACL